MLFKNLCMLLSFLLLTTTLIRFVPRPILNEICKLSKEISIRPNLRTEQGVCNKSLERVELCIIIAGQKVRNANLVTNLKENCKKIEVSHNEIRNTKKTWKEGVAASHINAIKRCDKCQCLIVEDDAVLLNRTQILVEDNLLLLERQGFVSLVRNHHSSYRYGTVAYLVNQDTWRLMDFFRGFQAPIDLYLASNYCWRNAPKDAFMHGRFTSTRNFISN